MRRNDLEEKSNKREMKWPGIAPDITCDVIDGDLSVQTFQSEEWGCTNERRTKGEKNGITVIRHE